MVEANIKSGPLFLIPEKKSLAEERGLAEVEGKMLTIQVLKDLIQLVRHHVSVVVSAMFECCHPPHSVLYRRKLDVAS